jgi:signal transduction histidine kinase
MRRGLGTNSISAKLTWLNLMVTGAALLLACLSFLAYDYVSYRENLIRNLSAAAQIAGTNSVTALLFDDQQAAQATLAAFKNSPDVIRATIVAENGKTFAQYRRPGSTAQIEPQHVNLHEIQARWTRGSEVLVSYRIAFSGRPLGTVYILARFGELGRRLRQYGLIAAAILLFCMGAALLATAAFRRLVTRPITALADTARVISREKDFSVRAEAAADQDEIAVLVEAFNEMLGEIQKRDSALQEARELLEKRVQERTAELRAANRELEAFSYSVAHDLRGPLDVIGGMSYVVQDAYQAKLDDEGKEMLETVQRTAKNMAALIDDLLNMARSTTAGLERKQVDLAAMARSIAAELESAEPRRHVTFTIARSVVVSADERLMCVAMENLIRNAWKYTSGHEHASIEFGELHHGSERIYFVRDDGAGFDPKRVDKLFQPFQRLHAESEFPGTGIGLATVQRIIARHGGRIWAEGEIEKGATFYFAL